MRADFNDWAKHYPGLLIWASRVDTCLLYRPVSVSWGVLSIIWNCHYAYWPHFLLKDLILKPYVTRTLCKNSKRIWFRRDGDITGRGKSGGGQEGHLPNWDASAREGARALGVIAIRHGVPGALSQQWRSVRYDDMIDDVPTFSDYANRRSEDIHSSLSNTTS